MSLPVLLLVILIVLPVASAPYTGLHPYGYYPSGLIGIVLLIVILLMLLGRF